MNPEEFLTHADLEPLTTDLVSVVEAAMTAHSTIYVGLMFTMVAMSVVTRYLYIRSLEKKVSEFELLVDLAKKENLLNQNHL